MSEIKPSNTDLRSENSDMTFTVEGVRNEMQGHIGSLVALAPEDSRKAALSWASRILGLPFGRVRSLYYGEARRIDAHEADQIRAYVQQAHTLIEARAEYEAKRQAFLRDNSRLVRLYPPSLADEKEEKQAVATPRKGRRG